METMKTQTNNEYVKGYKDGYKDGYNSVEYREYSSTVTRDYCIGYDVGYEDGVFREKPEYKVKL